MAVRGLALLPCERLESALGSQLHQLTSFLNPVYTVPLVNSGFVL